MASSTLIGLGAGLVSAVLFASATTGTWQAMLLFYLTPLPSFLAGLGWGWTSAGLAAVSGTVVAGAALGSTAALSYFLSIGLPVAALCHLALLSRPAPSPQPVGPGQPPSAIEWYPPGRLVSWATVMAGGLVAVSVPILGYDAESYRAAVHEMIENAVLPRVGPDSPQASQQSIDALINLLVRILPAATAVIWLLVAVFNMWAAGRIVDYSGRALRPWPDLSAMTYPNAMMLGLVASLALSFSPGMVGIIALAFAGAFICAYMLLGLVILHVITRQVALRGLLLTTVYLSIVLFGWVALIVAVVGLGDPVLKLRQRARNRATPPGPGRNWPDGE